MDLMHYAKYWRDSGITKQGQFDHRSLEKEAKRSVVSESVCLYIYIETEVLKSENSN